MNASNLLAWLNFFVADVRDGLGAFLGVFLLQNGFGEFEIGRIGTIASLIALVLGVPCGILVDKTTRKKELIGFFIAFIIVFCSLNYFFPSFIFTLFAQGLVALSGVFLAPAFAALTLGIVGVKDYPLQCAKNEGYKHAGTMFGAGLSFVFALHFGIASIFIITAILGAFSLVVLGFIQKSSIDDFTARGEFHAKKGENLAKSTSLWALFADKRVLFLAAVMLCFHLSNAAMLPLLSQRAQKLGVDSSGAYAAATIFIAQGTMILVAFICARLMSDFANSHKNLAKNSPLHSNLASNSARVSKFDFVSNSTPNLRENSLLFTQNDKMPNSSENSLHFTQSEKTANASKNFTPNSLAANSRANAEFKVYFWLFFACFFALIIRAGVAANFAGIGGMVITQVLDGVGAGASGVILPVIVAFMLRGSGHINAGLAFVMTCGGLGGALSASAGGYFAEFYGYFSAYVFLGAVAVLGLVLWCVGARGLFATNAFAAKNTGRG